MVAKSELQHGVDTRTAGTRYLLADVSQQEAGTGRSRPCWRWRRASNGESGVLAPATPQALPIRSMQLNVLKK